MKLQGGKIYNEDFILESKDIYIKDGKISFHGDDTDVINIDGNIIMPGNIDVLIREDTYSNKINTLQNSDPMSKVVFYEGKDADLIVIDNFFNIKTIIKKGKVIYTVKNIKNDLNTPITASQKEKFIRLRDEMLSSATTEWTLEQMATNVGYSLSRFCYLYKKIFNTSPMSDLSVMKVEISKKHLLKSDIPIGQVALISGFSSDSHYSYAFKKVTGITPTEYRINSRIVK